MDVRFLGFFACLPASQWNMEEQMPTLESDRPGLEYQLQHLSMCPGASPSTFLNLRVLHVSAGNSNTIFEGLLR